MLSIGEWIEGRRNVIDARIKMVCSNCTIADDEDREDWVANDEYLYLLAIEEGMDFS